MLVVVGLLIALATVGFGFLWVVESLTHGVHFLLAIGVVLAVLTIAYGAWNAVNLPPTGSIRTTPSSPDVNEVRPEHGDDFWPSIVKIWGPALGGWLDLVVFGGFATGVAAGAIVKWAERSETSP
jgi:hypothetical protein